jgi:S-adenosylmethionine synthetase
MGDIFVEQLIQTPVEEQTIELVERKGLGDPDSLCDSIANHASVALCQEYMKVFGRILHHNLDKALLVAGGSSPKIGGGTIEKPMRLILGDRATAVFQGKSIDVQGIVIEAAKDWMRCNLRFVIPERHVIFQNEIRAGSPELTDIFERGRIGANDTSAALGFAPFTLTEQVVFSVEKYLNSLSFKEQFPETGEDIKVMGLRHKRELHLTIAIAFVDRFVADSRTYFERKEEIAKYLCRYLGPLQRDYERIKVDINALDDRLRADDGMQSSHSIPCWALKAWRKLLLTSEWHASHASEPTRVAPEIITYLVKLAICQLFDFFCAREDWEAKKTSTKVNAPTERRRRYWRRMCPRSRLRKCTGLRTWPCSR